MYLNENNLMTDAQHGFRCNHSTSTGLLQITEQVRKELDNGNAVGMVAIDLSKAFDTIDHNILIKKLKSLNFGQGAVSFFSNYLSERTFMVRVKNDTSKIHNIKVGVPQGSILGPLLFTLYVNDMPRIVGESNIVLYADDTTLYTGSKYSGNIQVNLSRDIAELQKWFKSNKLKLNEDKTEFMIISNNRIRHRFDNIKIRVGDKLMNAKDELKILGVTIANDLSWDSHTTRLIGSLRHRFRAFSRSCKWLTVDTRKLLYNSAIASRLNYGDIVWDNCKQDSVNKLQTIQNRCVRRIMDSTPGASATPLINELGWLTLREKRKLHKCVMFHGLMQGKGPRALCCGTCR